MYYKLLLFSLLHASLGMVAISCPELLNPVESLVRQFANETLCRYGQCSASEELVDLLWSALNMCDCLGFCLSPVLLSYGSEHWGRRATVMLANSALLVTGSLLGFLSCVTNIFELLLPCRFLYGMARPLANYCFVYLLECSSVADGRIANGLVRFGEIIWYVVVPVLGLPDCLGTEESWHYLLLVPVLPALLYALSTLWVHESPKHLLITKNQETKSKQAIRFFYGPQADVDALLSEYRLEALHAQHRQKANLRFMLSMNYLKWPFLLCFVASAASRTAGSDIGHYYSTEALVDMGVSVRNAALYNVVILRLPLVVLAPLYIAFANRFSVRQYFLWTHLGATIGTTILCASISFHSNDAAKVFTMISLALQMMGYHFGPGLVSNYLPGEICPQISSSLTVSYCSLVKGVLSAVITLSYPPLAAAVGAYVPLLPMALASWIILVWFYRFMPETQNKNINEILSVWMDDEEAEETVPLQPSCSHHGH